MSVDCSTGVPTGGRPAAARCWASRSILQRLKSCEVQWTARFSSSERRGIVVEPVTRSWLQWTWRPGVPSAPGLRPTVAGSTGLPGVVPAADVPSAGPCSTSSGRASARSVVAPAAVGCSEPAARAAALSSHVAGWAALASSCGWASAACSVALYPRGAKGGALASSVGRSTGLPPWAELSPTWSNSATSAHEARGA